MRLDILLFTLLLIPPMARAQPASTAPVRAWPLGHSAHVGVFHERLGEALFLGNTGHVETQPMWGWNGRGWRAYEIAGPDSRHHFGFAYDVMRDRLVLHGGATATPGGGQPMRHGDTWEWNGRAWAQIADSSVGPGVRDHHAMVYDAARRTVLLFGGARDQTFFGDTWTWDGRAWRRLEVTGPAPRATHRMTYDSRRGIVVLFGGWGEGGRLLGDTWEWDGAAWRQVSDSGPSPRFASRLAYDAARNVTILFAGRGPNGDLGDTWSWDGRRWTRLDVTSPPLRNVHELVYDPRRQRVVLFGGFHAPTRYNDVWEWNGRQWTQSLPSRTPSPPGGEYLRRGTHAVGFRVATRLDVTRAAGAPLDFEGKPTGAPRSVPVQVSVWYPARAPRSATAMRYGEYLALGRAGPVWAEASTGSDSAHRAALRNMVRTVMQIELGEADVTATMQSPMAAVRDAPAAEGSFPVVLLGLAAPGNVARLGEYLASHGYIVVSAPAPTGTGAMQLATPHRAVDLHGRTLDVLRAHASGIPGADLTRLGIVALNFDGIPAVLRQMREMDARAIVSLDGWEAKPLGSTTLRTGTWCDPRRLRVPYLLFLQDEPPNPSLRPDTAMLGDLAYTERTLVVLDGIEHGHLVTDLFAVPALPAHERLAYDLLYRTTLAFLEAHVRGDTTAAALPVSDPAASGYPASLVALLDQRDALPPVPTDDEFEALVMAGNPARVRQVVMDAMRGDPEMRLFARGGMNVYAFRFNAQGRRDVALALLELVTEVYPRSALAWNDLGNGYRDAGDTTRAIAAWERALELVPTDAEIEDAEKERSRQVVQQKLEALRPSGRP